MTYYIIIYIWITDTLQLIYNTLHNALDKFQNRIAEYNIFALCW